MTGLPRVGVSRCLLGERVRYDGRCKFAAEVAGSLAAHCLLVPLCPEVEAGLPVPREPAHVGGSPLDPRFVGNHSFTDHTFRIMDFVTVWLDGLARRPLSGFVFKSGSPSCAAVRLVPVLGRDGRSLGRSQGLFARAFCQRYPGTPVTDERQLADPDALQRFLEAVRRWRARPGGAGCRL